MEFKELNDKAILEELGVKIRTRRLALNISQIELSRKAGVARIVVQNMESGRSSTVKGLIKVMRALGRIEDLNLILPEPGPSPLELAKLKGRLRQRASGLHMGKRTRGKNQ